MKSPRVFPCIVVATLATLGFASGQTLTSNLSFNVDGAFGNGVAQSSNSLLIVDNDLSNGYNAGMNLTDAPSHLNPTGPVGSASFQWGEAATWTAYPHSSALWFTPLSVSGALPEQSFTLGYLNYRNGTIASGTGASSVDLSVNLGFSDSNISPLSVNYTMQLENTLNGDDPVASADIVRLGNLSAPIEFTDASGNRYYLELTFRPDQTTLDGTLSTQNEFRVFEGAQGSAELVGRFTTTPVSAGGPAVPEPSSLLLGALGSLLLFRRRRD